MGLEGEVAELDPAFARGGETLWYDGELRRSVFSPSLRRLYELLGCDRHWRIGALLMDPILRLEGRGYHSLTAREILSDHHQVHVGAYSYGPCMAPGVFPPCVVGRYVSIAKGVRVFTQNHPYDRLSTHPFFYDPRAGLVEEQELPPGELFIGHDSWLGSGAIITPGCSRIGVGAVIAAGAVVTKDVDDFAVVAGNPAKLLRQRFSEPLCERALESRWWLRPIGEIAPLLDDMLIPLSDAPRHPLLRL